MAEKEPKREDNPQRETRSTDELLEKVKKRGSPDLSDISDAERAVVFDWYVNAELSSKDRVDFMEEFMRYGLIDDHAALEFIWSMDSKQKKQLGEYIGRTIRSVKYVQSFYECWPALDDTTRRELIKSFTTAENPRDAIMVAPFLDLEKVKTREFKEGYGSVERKSVLESGFDSIENAQKLLDALLAYYEGHPDIQEYGAKERSLSSDFRQSKFFHAEAIIIDGVINFYLQNKASVLYPYLEKLHDLGFLSEDQIKSLFEITHQYTPDQTKEEEIEIQRLTKKLKGSGEADFYFYSASEAAPRKYAFEIEKIRDRGAVRSAESILAHFKEQRAKFAFNHTKFLLDLIDRSVPVFLKVEELGLSKEEVRALILRSYREEGNFFNLYGYGDMKHLLEWNREQKSSEGPDLEKTITDISIGYLSEGENLGMAVHLEDILPWFEEDNRNKIIKAINRRAPHMWLLSLRYAIENRVMPLNTLIEKSARQSPYWYLYYFNNLLYHVSILKKEGKEIPVELEDVKKSARKILRENPFYFLDEKLRYAISQAFDESEREIFIDDQLKKESIDHYFFERLINSNVVEKYSESCRRILLSNPKLFGEMAESKALSKILSLKEITGCLVQNADSVNFEKVINENDELVLSLLGSPHHFEKLLEALEKSNNFAGLVSLAITLGSIKGNPETNIRVWKSNIETGEKKLKTLLMFQSAAPIAEKKDFQPKIDEVRSQLAKLKGDKPRERRTEHLRSLAGGYRGRLKEDIKKLCEAEKFLVFHKNTLGILGKDAEDIVKRDIEECVTIRPEILLREYPGYEEKRYGMLVFREMLGEEEFTRLFESRIRTLAFWSGRYGRHISVEKLPWKLAKDVKSKNPLLEVRSRKHLEDDFYQAVLDKIRGYNFYPLYADRLEKIAQEGADIYGQRLETETFEPRAKFVSLIKTVALLEDSNVALKNREAVLGLEPDKQDECVKMLEFIVGYHLDEGFDFDMAREDYSEVKQRMLARILEFGKKLFEMENAELSVKEPTTINALNALSIYYSRSCRENLAMKKVFHQTMSHILSGDYKNWRAWGDGDVPADRAVQEEKLRGLKEQGLLPSRLSLDQYTTWLKDENLNLAETFTYQISDIQSGIRDIFSLAVVDGHIEEAVLNIDGLVLAHNHQELLGPLKDLSKKQKEYRDRIQLSKTDKEKSLTVEEKDDYERIKKEIKEYREEHEHEIQRIEALRSLDRLRKLSIEELELKSLFIDQKRIPLVDVFRGLETVFQDKPDFLSDIRRVRDSLAEGNRRIFQGGRVARSQLHLTDRIDVETLVFIGEKPVESCQHYDGSDLNYGLLSYLSDPAVKVGQIWDDNGNIIARSIFRLMEDEKQHPQLFMERVYSINAHPKIKESMVRFGIQKAKSMGVGVFTQEEEYKELAKGDTDIEDKIVLHSKGSRSPYTYTDAGGGRMPGGVFTVEIYT